MNKKMMVAGAAILLVAVILIVLTLPAVRTTPTGQHTAQVKANAVVPTPEARDEQIKVKLVGITTILDVKKALLKVQWPADVSKHDESYVLSEGQSQDGIAVDSIDVTNGSVTLRVQQVTRTIRVEKGA